MEIKVDNASVEKIVEGQIKAAVLEALVSRRDDVIEHLVKAALSKKADDYSRRTVVEKVIDDAIIGEANAAATEWIAEQRPKIRALVKARLEKGHAELVKSIADQLVAKFSTGFDVTVWLKGRE
jgi:endonuclease III